MARLVSYIKLEILYNALT